MSADNNNRKKEIDPISGVETTGHEWDGLKELNNPAPRWWLWVFFVCVVWSLGYFVFYPAWPTISGATKGKLGWTSYRELSASQQQITDRQATYLGAFEKADFDQIMNDDTLFAFARAGGASAFKDNCATCHGTGGAGAKGYPNLNDDDWLWGGRIDDIYTTLQYGIRSGHDDARQSLMPAFGRDGLLTRAQIKDVTAYVLSLSSGAPLADDSKGGTIFAENCASCHGVDATGGRDFGAPNLRDAIWLYGGDEDMVFETVYNARAGVMPYWQGRLNDDTIRQLAVYVHSLGGGEATPIPDDAQTPEGVPEETPEQPDSAE